MRRLPAPAQGFRREWHRRPGPIYAAGNTRLMTYSVKEIFYTLQGEGANAGRAAVFCRFAGCNLWTRPRGRIEPRPSASSATPTSSAPTAPAAGGSPRPPTSPAPSAAAGPNASTLRRRRPLVVCTGGEPLLQLDAAAVQALHARGFEVAIETNGTRPPPGHRLDLRQPQGRRRPGADGGTGAQARLPPARSRPIASSSISRSSSSTSSPWTAPARKRTPASRPTTACSTRAGGSVFKPTN